jgi:hypothetical protein
MEIAVFLWSFYKNDYYGDCCFFYGASTRPTIMEIAVFYGASIKKKLLCRCCFLWSFYKNDYYGDCCFYGASIKITLTEIAVFYGASIKTTIMEIAVIMQLL